MPRASSRSYSSVPSTSQDAHASRREKAAALPLPETSEDEEEKVGLTSAAKSASTTPATTRSCLSRNAWIYIVIIGLLIIGAIVLAFNVLDRHEDQHEGQDEDSSGLEGNSSLPDLTLPQYSPVVEHFAELKALFTGNRAWRADIENEQPGLVSSLANGQHPMFGYLGCSDSRVPETSVFKALPGDLFVERSIGNQALIDDLNTEAWLSYGVAHVGVKHIIVMGHYGCGAVQAAIASPATSTADDIGTNRIEAFIRPIRGLFASSQRPEIVEYRQKYAAGNVPAPNRTEPAFRALVEENVKASVSSLANDPSVQAVWRAYSGASSSVAGHQRTRRSSTNAASNSTSASDAKPGSQELWIHGFIYDIDTGLVNDLGVSVGPLKG